MSKILLLLALLGTSIGAHGRIKAVGEKDVLRAMRQCGVNWEIEVNRAIGDPKVFWWRSKRTASKETIETVNKGIVDRSDYDEARLPNCIESWAKRHGVKVYVDLGSVVY